MAAKPGIALKKLRKSNRWTLADVSKRTGVPASTLSRIENDQVSPTYDLLVRLSTGLDIDLAQLLSLTDLPAASAARQPGRRSINRVTDGDVIEMPSNTARYLSADLLGKQIAPIVNEYLAQSLEEFGAFIQRPGEEFIYVVEGELEIHTEIYAPVVLGIGESIYFDSRMGHAYVARTRPCRALSIFTMNGDRPNEGE